MTDDNSLRLSKLMAYKGLCSRREADQLIAKGWVKVDGQVVSELGTQVSPKADITLSSEAQKLLNQKVTIILNKPLGYLSSPSNDNYPLAVQLVRSANQDRNDRRKNRFDPIHLKGLAPAGRLDIDSKGLLVLTQNGVLAKQIIGENSPVDKEYLVRVKGHVEKSKLARLEFGISLDNRLLKRAKVKQLQPNLLQFILCEGRKRQIRRMCEAVELKVLSLKRVRIGKLRLNSLKEGQWRYLGSKEKV